MMFFLKLVLASVAGQLVSGHARADLLGDDVVRRHDSRRGHVQCCRRFRCELREQLAGRPGYQVSPYQFGRFDFGPEAGLAGRFGPNASGGLWGSVAGRHDGVALGSVRIAPSFTFGLSHVTQSRKGCDRDREQKRNGDARTMFYLAPEVSLSSDKKRDTEILARMPTLSTSAPGDSRMMAHREAFMIVPAHPGRGV